MYNANHIYRAVIMDVINNMYKLFYIDYGKVEYVIKSSIYMACPENGLFSVFIKFY